MPIDLGQARTLAVNGASGGPSVDDAAPHHPAHFNTQVVHGLSLDLAVLLRQSRGACYALIDSGLCAPGAFEGLVRAHALQAEPLFARTRDRGHAESGPWLVALPAAPGPTLIEALAVTAGVTQAMSLLSSALPPERLHAHLRGWFDGILEDGTEVLLRWYDPRIAVTVLCSWPEEPRRQFMQAFQWWVSWDARFSPMEVSPAERSRQPAAAPRQRPLPVSADMLLALADASQAEHMLFLTRDEDIDPGELDHIAPAMQRLIARSQIANAHDLSLHSWDDRRVWVTLGLRIGPAVARDPQLREFARYCASHSGGLLSFLGRVPPDHLAALHERAARDLAEIAELVLAKMQARANASAPHPFAALA